LIFNSGLWVDSSCPVGEVSFEDPLDVGKTKACSLRFLGLC
jgi:hypothetical protein